MKITNSAVAMVSSHQESSYTYKESATLDVSISKEAPAAIVSLSAEAKKGRYMEAMASYKDQQEKEVTKQQKDGEDRALKHLADRVFGAENKKCKDLEPSDQYKQKLELIRRMFEMLNKGKKLYGKEEKLYDAEGIRDLRSPEFRTQSCEVSIAAGASMSASVSAQIAVGTNETGTTWQKITASSGFTCETECTTFATQGIVQTKDGRNIDFNMEVSMSRAFMEEINTLEVENYIKTDPLMINLDTDIGKVSDQKFYFDLDSDGKQENISFAGNGSGFLALDRNGDGKINDGSELFGTKSGDGFKDLSAFDEDGNGWIDENDSIFSRLKIWTKDEDGNDYLMDLKKADVGAIYLGNADTQFSLKNEENKLNAEIKKTGIYLKESSGVVGTMNHVDLVI